MRKLVITLYLINLFIIGSIIGVAFAKENPKSFRGFFLTGSTIRYPKATLDNQNRNISVGLKEAVNQTISMVSRRWMDLLEYARDFNFSNIGRFFENKRKFISMEDLKETNLPVKTINNKLTVSVKKITPEHYVQDKQSKTKNKLVPKLVTGRLDPFLPLRIKKTDTIKPNTEKKPISEKKPIIKESIQIEEKPKTEKIDLKAKILKNFHLRGVVIGKLPTAYIEDQTGYRKVTIGEYLAEGRIINITGTGLIIQVEGEQFFLGLEE